MLFFYLVAIDLPHPTAVLVFYLVAIDLPHPTAVLVFYLVAIDLPLTTRASSPLAIYGEGVADRPGVRSQAGGEVRNLYPRSRSTLSITQSWAFFLS